MTDTLLTKIMLGVFGNVPALDQYFGIATGCWTLNDKFLVRMQGLYNSYSESVDAECKATKTLDFRTGEATSRSYTRAKILDMALFVAGSDGTRVSV